MDSRMHKRNVANKPPTTCPICCLWPFTFNWSGVFLDLLPFGKEDMTLRLAFFISLQWTSLVTTRTKNIANVHFC